MEETVSLINSSMHSLSCYGASVTSGNMLSVGDRKDEDKIHLEQVVNFSVIPFHYQ